MGHGGCRPPAWPDIARASSLPSCILAGVLMAYGAVSLLRLFRVSSDRGGGIFPLSGAASVSSPARGLRGARAHLLFPFLIDSRECFIYPGLQPFASCTHWKRHFLGWLCGFSQFICLLISPAVFHLNVISFISLPFVFFFFGGGGVLFKRISCCGRAHEDILPYFLLKV